MSELQDRLNKLAEETRILRAQVAKAKKEDLDKLIKFREDRTKNIKDTYRILDKILQEIFNYKKQGKKIQYENNVLGKIKYIINHDGFIDGGDANERN